MKLGVVVAEAAGKPRNKKSKARPEREKLGHRPPDITPEIIAKVAQAIKRGCYAQVAARSAGISKSSFYRWLERGEKEETGIYRDFWNAIEQADAEAEQWAAERLATIAEHATPNTTAGLIAYLERRFPERWSRGERREVGFGDKAPTLIINLTPKGAARGAVNDVP